MRQALAFTLVVVSIVGATAFSGAARQVPANGAGASQATVDDALKAFRADMQASRADIMAKNMTLDANQAAKFWPMFEQYQKEQNVLMDEQMKGIQKFVDSYETLNDADAIALMNAHLDRDAKMNTLRQKWLTEFQKALPPRLAARAMQIDRRLSLVAQLELASRIPLIH